MTEFNPSFRYSHLYFHESWSGHGDHGNCEVSKKGRKISEIYGEFFLNGGNTIIIFCKDCGWAVMSRNMRQDAPWRKAKNEHHI